MYDDGGSGKEVAGWLRDNYVCVYMCICVGVGVGACTSRKNEGIKESEGATDNRQFLSRRTKVGMQICR